MSSIKVSRRSFIGAIVAAAVTPAIATPTILAPTKPSFRSLLETDFDGDVVLYRARGNPIDTRLYQNNWVIPTRNPLVT